jgi:hypothetical protein
MKVLKIVLTAVCIAALIPSAQAQKVGVRAGLNIATVTGDGFGDTKPLTGFYAGVFKEITIVPELFFYNLNCNIQCKDLNLKIRIMLLATSTFLYLLKCIS